MKKITLGLVVVLTVMAFVVGCSNFGATGNPTDLTGAWTAATSSFSGSTSEVGSSEGTWYGIDVTLPTPATVTIDDAGVTTTTYGGTQADVTTETETWTVVLAADSSWVKTYTLAHVETARAEIPAVGTGSAQTNGSPALTAGSWTRTIVTTTTPTQNIDSSWTVRTVVAYSIAATGTYVGAVDNGSGTPITMTATAKTVSNDTTNANAADSGWVAEIAPLDQIVLGAGLGTDYNRQTDVAYSLDITKEGAYTLTTTTTVTDLAPGDGGTRTTTVVETGTVLGATATGFDSGDALVTFNETNLETTYEATGTLISAAYPETAETVTQAVAASKIFKYLITKGSDVTSLQVFSTASIGFTFQWPAFTLTK